MSNNNAMWESSLQIKAFRTHYRRATLFSTNELFKTPHGPVNTMYAVHIMGVKIW